MDKEGARKELRRILNEKGHGAISISMGHPRDRAAERKFTMQDALRIIVSGRMKNDPIDHKLGFQCVLSGTLDDGRLLEIPVIVDQRSQTIRVKTFKRVG